MATAKYIALFALIQLVSLVLIILGVPIVGLLAYFYAWEPVGGKFQWRGDPLAALVIITVVALLALHGTWWSFSLAFVVVALMIASLIRGGSLVFLWGNLEDGIVGPGMALNRWNAFYWSAYRNPCNNLRYLPGVSKVGRPLWRKTWGAKPGGWYVQAGWNHSGFPVLSPGRNVNPY
jgi:hypothetical protein